MSSDTPKDRFIASAESRQADSDQDVEQNLWTGGYSGKAMYGTCFSAGWSPSDW